MVAGTCEDVDHRDRGQWKSQSRGGSGGASYETEIIDEMFEPKSVACVSKSTDNDSETVFEEEIVPSKKQDSKAAIYNTQYKISEGNTENISDSNITVRKDKTNLKRVAIPSLQAEASNRTRSAISSTGSGVDLSWFDEYSMDVKQNISRQTSYTSDVKVFVEDETTRGRIDSDTDSVEGMIDKMTRPHLHVEVLQRPTRPSEADSEGSFNMTPISPLPPDTFETRTGTYTLTYMSDDNLDAVSTDDNLDAGSDIEKQIEPNIEETVEKRVIVGRSEKQTLKAKNSLDLLITKQGNLLKPDQDFVEIDAEFNEALKIADEHDSRKHWSDFGRKDTNGISFQELEIDSQEKNKPVKVHQSKNKAAQVSKKDSYDNVDSSIKSDDFEVQIRAVPGRTAEVRKTKLAPLKSLDLLIFNQGGLVDPRESSVELDAELQAALEQHFQGMQSPDLDLEEVVKVSEKHVDFLGMQLNLGSEAGAKVSGIVHTEKESTHVNKSSEQDITDGTEIVIPPDIVTQRIKLMQENESSEESDILSVIEEEEEFSESSEQPDEGKLKSSATSVLQTPIITKELKEPVEESTVTKSERNIKLADKVKLMEDKVRQITEVGKSPGHEKHEGYDVKVYSKFKKLQERWNAIEKHEADLLDFDDDTGHATNNINNKKEEVTNYNTSKVPVLGQKSTDKENESVSSVNVNVYSKASTDERLGTGSDINVAEEPTIEETVEKRVIVGRKEKQKLKATHSLDLLLAKQGIFLEPEQDIVAEDSDTEILLAPEKQFAHESKEIDRKEVFGDENFQNILMQTAKSLNISMEISDNSEESLPDTHEAYVDNFDLISKTSVSEVQLRAMPGRRTTETKRTYGKIGSSEFIEDKVTQDSDIKKTTNDDPDDDPIRHSVPVRHYISKADPFRLSINDKNGRCHSLTDLSIDLESSQDETIQEAANEQGQDINIHDSLARCQSSEGEMGTGNVVKSIHESVNECQSIAEDDASAAFYGSDRCISIEEKSEDHVFTANAKIYSEKAEEDASETMHRPLVRLSKLRHGRKVSDPSKKNDFRDLDRSDTYTVKKSLSNSSSKSEHEQAALGTDKSNNNELAEIFGSQKQDEYKEVKEDNFMQTDNKEENDLVFPPEPQCFKVPSIPIKIESRLSSSSVPSSPDLSFDLPFTPVDSPRSGIVTVYSSLNH